jgi:myosin-5
MTRLSYLHEPGVLDNLAVRYAKNIIYVSDALLLYGKLNYYVSQFSLMLFS